MKPSIIRLRALEKQLYAYLYALTVIDFDAETIAPEGSADGRAEATEVLSRANFDLLVNEKTAALLKKQPPMPRPSRKKPRCAICSASTTKSPRFPPTNTPPSPSCAARACPPGSRPSAPTTSAPLRRIWKRSSPPAAPRPTTLRPTATPTRCCWTATRRA